MDASEDALSLEGTVKALVYQNGENGYTVLRLSAGEKGTVVVVGSMPGVSPGEKLTVTGCWTRHPSYGEQFRADTVERHMPSEEEGILSYLSSGAVKGVGPATAKRIVKRFGRDTLKILEEESDRLTEVAGVTAKKARQIAEGFRYQAGMRLLIEFLSRYGLPAQISMKLYRRYGADSLQAVRDNPYLLADEYYGVPFAAADQIALGQGWSGDARERLEAALLFELSHNMGNGHTFLPLDKLVMATEQLIGEDAGRLREAAAGLAEQGSVVVERVGEETACYLRGLYEAERYVAERLAELADRPARAPGNVETLIRAVEQEQGISYAEEQRRAVRMAAGSCLLLLTGGPGTGKTTCVRGILELFRKMGLEVALTAPTGRAAKRIGELCGTEAQTIHRLLGTGFDEETGELGFSRDEDDPLEAEAVIVDETSMVDITLMRALLAAMRPACRLILVGDPDQLPSVGPGNLFSDLIRSGRAETVRLTEIFRQARESAIILNAHAVNRGEPPDLRNNRGDFFFLQRRDPARAVDTVLELCKTRLPERMGIDPSQIQVLSPTRRHETGTTVLNRRLQAALNPPEPGKKEKIFGEYTFREGDRVMQIRNNYDIMWEKSDHSGMGAGVFNGDVGRILSVDPRGESVSVCFDDRLVEYSGDMLGDLEPAYAMTVHKAQGSEYRAVILLALEGAPVLMSRSVLYTAMTRAKELLIIVGEEEAVLRMTRNSRQRKRYSGLRARLCGEARGDGFPEQNGIDTYTP